MRCCIWTWHNACTDIFKFRQSASARLFIISLYYKQIDFEIGSSEHIVFFSPKPHVEFLNPTAHKRFWIQAIRRFGDYY